MQGDLFVFEYVLVFVYSFVFVFVRTKEKDESSLIVWKLEAAANQAKFLLLSLRWKCWEGQVMKSGLISNTQIQTHEYTNTNAHMKIEAI